MKERWWYRGKKLDKFGFELFYIVVYLIVLFNGGFI